MFSFLFQLGCIAALILNLKWNEYDNLPYIAFLLFCVEAYKIFSCPSRDIHISRPIAVIAVTCIVLDAVDVYSVSIGYCVYWCLWTVRNIVFCCLDAIINRFSR